MSYVVELIYDDYLRERRLRIEKDNGGGGG